MGEMKMASLRETFAFAGLACLLSSVHAQSAGSRFEVSAGYGFGRVGDLAFVSTDAAGEDLGKPGGEETRSYSGFNVSGTMAVTRWFGAMLNISGGYESGEFQTPPTIWRTPILLVVPGSKSDGRRSAYSFLAGVRVKDNTCPWRAVPSAYLLAGMARQSLGLESGGSQVDAMFFGGEPLSQSGFALAVGVGADVRVYKGIGLRLNVDYNPIFASETQVLGLTEIRHFINADRESMQTIVLEGGIRSNMRAAAGPYYEF